MDLESTTFTYKVCLKNVDQNPFCFLLKLRKKKRKGINHPPPPHHHPVTQIAQVILSPLLILLILKVLLKRNQKKEKRNIGKIPENTRKKRRSERKARKGLNFTFSILDLYSSSLLFINKPVGIWGQLYTNIKMGIYYTIKYKTILILYSL